MSWTWAALLVVGAGAACLFAWLTSMSRREVERLKLVRAEIHRARRRRAPTEGR